MLFTVKDTRTRDFDCRFVSWIGFPLYIMKVLQYMYITFNLIRIMANYSDRYPAKFGSVCIRSERTFTCIIEQISGRMVSKCRRYIFGCFDALPRNVITWIKIQQLILLEEMPENLLHFKYWSKNFFYNCLGSLMVKCQASDLKV